MMDDMFKKIMDKMAYIEVILTIIAICQVAQCARGF